MVLSDSGGFFFIGKVSRPKNDKFLAKIHNTLGFNNRVYLSLDSEGKAQWLKNSDLHVCFKLRRVTVKFVSKTKEIELYMQQGS